MSITESAVDEAKRRAAISNEIFGMQLREFVRRWAPSDRDNLFEFQLEMTRLMVAAMDAKSDAMSLGISTYAEHAFTQMALRPLHIIRDEAENKARQPDYPERGRTPRAP